MTPMLKLTPVLLIALIATFCSREKGSLTGNAHPDYKKYCASCHGQQAESFVQRTWKHGNSRLDIIRAIKEGYAAEGMPGFKASLKEAQIFGIADYIVQTMEQQKDKKIITETLQSAAFQSAGMNLRLDTVASGLESPWGMTFLPTGELLFTEKAGTLWKLGQNGKKIEIKGVPKVSSDGQGGLLDIELHPRFIENKLIYLSYSKPKTENGKEVVTTAVYRAKLLKEELVEGSDIFIAEPFIDTKYHFGSRLEFSRDGYLFVTVGERGKQDLFPQALDTAPGKIHRIKDDGSIPPNNPMVDQSGALASIWSYGHRNPQGMAFQPGTNLLWAHEHGPRGGDELNLIQPGKNYGWPITSYGTHYDGRSFTDKTTQEGIEAPITYWVPSIAPCGMTFISGDRYPGWKGDLMIGSLRFKYLNRCKMQDNQVVEQEQLLENIGRMRCLTMSPDGYLYLSVEEPGFIFRIVPQ